jgi:hypothetical protein
MKHTPEQLLDIIFQHYPRGNAPPDKNTAEHHRLVAARLRAGTTPDYEHWRTMIARLKARFPDCKVENWSFHLLTGDHDGGYRGELALPAMTMEGGEIIGFYVSFLVPYYVIYARRRSRDGSEASLELNAAEQPYARGITEEITSSYPGYEPLPPHIGGIRVPDVALGSGAMKATMYDLLFSEYDRLVLDEEERREKAIFMDTYRKMHGKE